MGRQESLAALALGRGLYEDELITDPDAQITSDQQYNDRGYPKNPETKRREKEQVRAANEVMQVTGIVEDSTLAKEKATQAMREKNEDTFLGLRLMEVGRVVLVGGVWGVLGLRRRVLLYKPYAQMTMLEILRHEKARHSIPHMLFAGLPTVVAYHVSDWVAFFAETVLDTIWDEEGDELIYSDSNARNACQRALDIGFCYITLHFRMFAILQQLDLISSTHLLPNFMSFIPFTSTSPLQLPASPSLAPSSLVSWGFTLFQTASPLLIILLHGKVKHLISRLVYRPIYKTLPRPTGDSMFSSLAINAPTMEYDTPDRPFHTTPGVQPLAENVQTLRALEGLPVLDAGANLPQPIQNDHDSSEEEDDDDMAHPTLISFDVEATESVGATLGTWSAELRSANEPTTSDVVKYRVTGLTMLPPIMATEGIREIVAGILVLPFEAAMVRLVGRAHRVSAGLPVDDIYSTIPWPSTFPLTNVLSALSIQLAITGAVWAGYTICTQRWTSKHRKEKSQDISDEMSGDTSN